MGKNSKIGKRLRLVREMVKEAVESMNGEASYKERSRSTSGSTMEK